MQNDVHPLHSTALTFQNMHILLTKEQSKKLFFPFLRRKNKKERTDATCKQVNFNGKFIESRFFFVESSFSCESFYSC